jgi:Rieske Fe-S protein
VDPEFRDEQRAMNNTPHWEKDFPVRQSAEHQTSRRQFVKIACCSALAVGAGWLAKDKLFARAQEAGPKLLGRMEEIPVGGYKLFRYPTESDPCIIVRLSETELVAYSQACTHLMCPVNYQHDKRQFYCPCHEGFFSAEDGHVLAGPPPRPLPRIKIEVRDGAIHAVGLFEA